MNTLMPIHALRSIHEPPALNSLTLRPIIKERWPKFWETKKLRPKFGTASRPRACEPMYFKHLKMDLILGHSGILARIYQHMLGDGT